MPTRPNSRLAHKSTSYLACVAGVQRGGREKLNSDPNNGAFCSPRTSRSHSTSPLPPLCTPTTQATSYCDEGAIVSKGARASDEVARSFPLKTQRKPTLRSLAMGIYHVSNKNHSTQPGHVRFEFSFVVCWFLCTQHDNLWPTNT